MIGPCKRPGGAWTPSLPVIIINRENSSNPQRIVDNRVYMFPVSSDILRVRAALVFHEFHHQELFKPNSVDICKIVEINIGTMYHHCTSHARPSRSSGTHTGLYSPRQKYPSNIRGYINRTYSIWFNWSTPRNAKKWTTTSMGAQRIDKDKWSVWMRNFPHR